MVTARSIPGWIHFCTALALSMAVGVASAQTLNPYNVSEIDAQDMSAVADQEAQLVQDADGRYEYIVLLDEKAASKYSKSFASDERYQSYNKGEVVNLVQDVERAYGLHVSRVYSWALVGFSAFLTEDEAKKLSQDPRVTSMERSHLSKASGVDTQAVWTDSVQTQAAPPLGLWDARVTQAAEMQPWWKRAVSPSVTTNTNSEVLVYVIDQGVGQHVELNVVERLNINNPSTWICGTRAGVGITPCTSAMLPNVVGCYTHATAVAGVIGAKANGAGIQGIFPNAKIVSIALPPTASGTCVRGGVSDAMAVQAFDWVYQDISTSPDLTGGKPSVVNFSVNSTGQAVVNSVMRKVATRVGSYRGAFVTQSAGNGFTNAVGVAYAVGVPGNAASSTDGIMVVGGLNNHGQPVVPLNTTNGYWKDFRDASGSVGAHEPGSNYGPSIDAWAPSDAIFTSVGAMNAQDANAVYSTYGYMSGTSFAAPMVAGLAAYIIQNNVVTSPADVEGLVRQKFMDLGSRAPTTSSISSFHNNAGNPNVNMPTLSPLAAGVARSTPYAEFVVGTVCKYAGYKSGACGENFAWGIGNQLPFNSDGTVNVSYAPNRWTLARTGTADVYVNFDSYGTAGYTCNVTYGNSVSGPVTVYSGTLPYYNDVAHNVPANSTFNSSCTSASVGVQ